MYSEEELSQFWSKSLGSENKLSHVARTTANQGSKCLPEAQPGLNGLGIAI